MVCTGNVCRSPYIERLLRGEVERLGVRVASAGTMALHGEPMQDGTAALLTDRGLNADGFVARQLTPAMVVQADLVLTATREHRSQVVRTAPSGLRYVFALNDFSDLVSGIDPMPGAGPDVVAQLVTSAVARRDEVAARGADDADIEDPFRQGPQEYARMAEQVAAVLPQIIDALRHLAASP